MNIQLPTETDAMRRVIKVAKSGDMACQLQLAETYMWEKFVSRTLIKEIIGRNNFI